MTTLESARCGVHIEEAAVSTCTRCGRFMCPECRRGTWDGLAICVECEDLSYRVPMAARVKALGVLLILNGGLILMPTLLALFGAVGSLVVDEQPAEVGPVIMLSLMTVAGGAVGLLQVIAGVQLRRYRGRVLGIVAVSVGMLAVLSFYCAPPALILFVLALVILLNTSVTKMFEAAKEGEPVAEVEARFLPVDARKHYWVVIGSVLGFLLLIVLFFGGLIAAIAVPTFMTYIDRSKAAEASANVHSIAAAARNYHERTRQQEGGGRFPPSTPLTPAASCCDQPDDKCISRAEDWDAPGWRELGWTLPDKTHRYQYSLENTGGSGPDAKLIVRAVADLDCDGGEDIEIVTVGVNESGEAVVEPWGEGGAAR